MLKKTIKYVDYNGTERTDNLYFHISKTSVLTASNDTYNEIMKIAEHLQNRAKVLEGLDAQTINEENPFDPNNRVLAESIRMIAQLIDRLVDLSYGKRSDDGTKFIKNAQVLEDFKSSLAYEAFVEQMVSNPDEMIEFINQLVAK